ncbi:hypothetical protein VFPPC_16162 [Pochonia chlamydosporia 170]|uniref:Uncharacterized protein n=1 Tax=Pochonia chlamydosporia 170 TaxID=1380566 RepID=A0A179FFL4_METCM|nr:hypothetical protein VFPPC_16162 [Pochonia chlamydosporia 170]OAQ64138.1 hypothetical protein VFPPC_16162 [Pochonia chlamydosporia 170]
MSGCQGMENFDVAVVAGLQGGRLFVSFFPGGFTGAGCPGTWLSARSMSAGR